MMESGKALAGGTEEELESWKGIRPKEMKLKRHFRTEERMGRHGLDSLSVWVCESLVTKRIQ